MRSFFNYSLTAVSHTMAGHLKFYLDTLVYTRMISTFFILPLYFVIYRLHPNPSVNFRPHTSLLKLQM